MSSLDCADGLAMVVFPLGLQAKSRRFPVATVLVCVVTVVYSILRFPLQERAQEELLSSHEHAAVFRARVALLVKACENTSLKADHCDFFRSHFAQNSPETFLRSLDELERAIKKRFVKPSEAQEVAQSAALWLSEDQEWLAKESELASLKEFAAYKAAQQKLSDLELEINQRAFRLSKATLSFRTLIEASLTHGGWMHLLGNMILFVLLAIPVEERAGRLIFVALYGSGGVLGLALFTLMNPDPHRALLGASAGVSAVAGAFMILFWRHGMRLWISFMMLWSRVVEVPTYFYVPVFLVLGDLTGALGGGGNVAHSAHLIGFAWGAILAFLLTQFQPIAPSQVFPFESELLRGAGYAAGDEKLKRVHEVLYHNPRNLQAHATAMNEFEERQSDAHWAKLSRSARQFLELHFAEIFNGVISKSLREPGAFALSSLIERVPQDWPLVDLLSAQHSDVDMELLRKAVQEESRASGSGRGDGRGLERLCDLYQQLIERHLAANAKWRGHGQRKSA